MNSNNVEVVARKRELDLLVRRIEGHSRGFRQNVAILGMPYIGKSFILSQAIKSSPLSIISAVVDVRNTDPTFFARSLFSSLLSSLLRNSVRIIDDDFEDMLEASKQVIPNCIRDIKELFSLDWERDFYTGFDRMFDVLEKIIKETGKRLVLAFENFEALEEFPCKDIFDILAGEIISKKDIMFILTSSSIGRAKDILDFDLSLLFGNFERIEVEPLKLNTGKDYVYSLLPEEVPDNITKFILAFTGGNPFYIRLICDEMLAIYRIEKDLWHCLIQAVYKLVFSPYGILYQHFWSESSALSDGPHSPSMPVFLLATTKESNIETMHRRFNWKRQHLLHKLNVLRKKGIVYRDHNNLFFQDELFAFWIKYVYRYRVEKVNIDPDSEFSRAEYILRREIANFIEKESLDVNRRLIKLFNSLSEEFILLPDGKRHRFYEVKDIICFEEGFCAVLMKKGFKWAFMFRHQWSEDDMFDFVEKVKADKYHRVIAISKERFVSPVKVIAKQKKVWLWGIETVNYLFEVHNLGEIIW